MRSSLLKIGLLFVSLNIVCIEVKAEDIMQTINQLLLERNTGERLRLSQHFKKTIIDVPDKMKRIDIINAPLFFKNNVDDYELILKYMIEYLDKKINQLKVMTASQQKNYNFKSNYSKLEECVQKHHSLYEEEFGYVNKKYIRNLSKDEQDMLYVMLNTKLYMFKLLFNGCVVYFNKTSDSYNEIVKG